MFNFLFKKEQHVQKLLFEYLDTMKLCQDSFLKALQSCLLNGVLCENFDFFIKQTHKFESKADDIHDEINNLMYGKALIPDYRDHNDFHRSSCFHVTVGGRINSWDRDPEQSAQYGRAW